MKAIEPSLVKDNFIEIIGKEWMLVSAGDKDKFNMMTALTSIHSFPMISIKLSLTRLGSIAFIISHLS